MKFCNAVMVLFSVLMLSSFGLSANDDGSSGSGIIEETIEVDPYIYAKLKESGTWVAAPRMPISKGDEVSYSNGMLMTSFHSSKLNRTFEKIYFVPGLEVISSSSTDADVDLAAIHHTEGKKVDFQAAPAAGDIQPLEGGMTIAAIYSGLNDQNGQNVALRARVMKFSPNIMGKNWITLQDGTGTLPDDKLIATTDETVQIGDTVEISGILRADVDLGSGYTYKAVLEQATTSN